MIFVIADAAGGVYNSSQLCAIAAVAESEGAFLKITESGRVGFFLNPENWKDVQPKMAAEGILLRHYRQSGAPSPNSCLGELCPHHEQPALEDAIELTSLLSKRYGDSFPFAAIALNGCAIGCASSGTQDVHLVGEGSGYKLSMGGRAAELPQLGHLVADNIPREKLGPLLVSLFDTWLKLAAPGESLFDVIDAQGIGEFLQAADAILHPELPGESAGELEGAIGGQGEEEVEIPSDLTLEDDVALENAASLEEEVEAGELGEDEVLGEELGEEEGEALLERDDLEGEGVSEVSEAPQVHVADEDLSEESSAFLDEDEPEDFQIEGSGSRDAEGPNACDGEGPNEEMEVADLDEGAPSDVGTPSEGVLEDLPDTGAEGHLEDEEFALIEESLDEGERPEGGWDQKVSMEQIEDSLPETEPLEGEGSQDSDEGVVDAPESESQAQPVSPGLAAPSSNRGTIATLAEESESEEGDFDEATDEDVSRITSAMRAEIQLQDPYNQGRGTRQSPILGMAAYDEELPLPEKISFSEATAAGTPSLTGKWEGAIPLGGHRAGGGAKRAEGNPFEGGGGGGSGEEGAGLGPTAASGSRMVARGTEEARSNVVQANSVGGAKGEAAPKAQPGGLGMRFQEGGMLEVYGPDGLFIEVDVQDLQAGDGLNFEWKGKSLRIEPAGADWVVKWGALRIRIPSAEAAQAAKVDRSVA